MDLEKAQEIASEVVKQLSEFCDRIEVAGSIRRQKPIVNDIDLVVIPRDRWSLDTVLLRMGKYKMSGNKIARVQMDSISLDIYFATPETWATLFLIRTGSAEFNRMLAARALQRGLQLKANGQGVVRGLDIIADKSEADILKALGLPYLEPWEREMPLRREV